MMILGVSSRVVPILAGRDSRRMNSFWGPFILINLGCTGRVVLQVATDFVPRIAYPLIGFTGFIELTALLWWGIELWHTMNIAKDEPHQSADCAFSVSGPVIAGSKTVLNTARGQHMAERKTVKL